MIMILHILKIIKRKKKSYNLKKKCIETDINFIMYDLHHSHLDL